MPEIISRKEARAKGLTRYFTGKPCEAGHVCEGLVDGSRCIECNRVRARKRYYKNHKASKKQGRELARQRYAKDPQRHIEASRRFRARNLELVRARERQRRAARDRLKRLRNCVSCGRFFTTVSRGRKAKTCSEACRVVMFEKRMASDRQKELRRKIDARQRKVHRESRLASTRKWREQNAVYLKKYYRTYRLNGPKNPKGEMQWLRKNQAQLRSVKRLLRRLSHGQHPSPNSAFTMPTDSPK